MKNFVTQNKLKSKNTSDLLSFIIEKKTVSRKTIQNETGFAWGTVSSNVNDLISRGYLKEVKSDASGAGRKTGLLTASGEKLSVIGIDVNLSGISIKTVAFNGQTLKTLSMPFTAKTQEQLFLIVFEHIKKEIESLKLNGYELLSVGISFQGALNGEKGISYGFPMKDWKPINVKALAAQELGVPVFLDHDPRCLLRAETFGTQDKNVLLLRADGGLGLAVMIDGKILEDDGKFEIGKTVYNYDNKLYTLEEIFSKNPEVAINAVFAALYNCNVLFVPDKIILSGFSQEDGFVENLTKSFSTIKTKNHPKIVIGTQTADYGAALSAINLACKNV